MPTIVFIHLFCLPQLVCLLLFNLINQINGPSRSQNHVIIILPTIVSLLLFHLYKSN